MCTINENLINLIEKSNNKDIKSIHACPISDIKNTIIIGEKVIEIKLKRKYAGKERKWDERLL